MRILLTLIILTNCTLVHAQNRYVKVSGGYIVFGTGDVQGYSIKVEYAKNLIRNFRFRLFIGPEFSFENGVQTPRVLNPSREEFMFGPSFYHITNTILTGKVSYYPFHRIIPGFQVMGGLSLGYSNKSSESQADLVTLANGDRMRRSYLHIDNGFIYGYRVGSGYEFTLTTKFSTGVLIELHNYKDNDLNTFWGGHIAWHF